MSAFVVSHAHINALVSYGNGPRDSVRVTLADGSVLRFDDSTDQQRAATILLAENYRSVHYRYPDTAENPENTPGVGDDYAEPIIYRPSSYYPRQAAHILKMLACYDYQACETGDYYESDAAKIIDALRHRAIRNVDGYDDAPWDWDMPDFDAIRARIAAGMATPNPLPPSVDPAEQPAPAFTVTHEREWTWIKFAAKPADAVRATLKAIGAHFSAKREAWYVSYHLDAATLAQRLSF